MFDHVQIKVTDFERSVEFYRAIFDALGYGVVFQDDGVIGFGNSPHDMFEIRRTSESAPLSKSTHVAFVAKSEDAVRTFHKAALEHGAKDNGTPGFREYEEGYFAAFVIDPDGHNLEAVFKR